MAAIDRTATPADSDIHNDNYRATYCPEDNKIRLYCGRVARPTYDALATAGYKATPKQDCDFVATWSIQAEDLAFLLIPEDMDIEDEDYSPEERAADRAERFGGYRDKRRSEAGAYADRFEAGPDAHGYQNAARAERAAARHDRQRDRALCQWSKAEYWQVRTAGVISHALHKSDPETRRGRILVIERDLRKAESNRQESIDVYDGWKMVATMEGAEELLPQDGETKPNAAGAKAYNLANHYHGGGFKRDEEEANQAYRDCHRREPAFSAYDLLTSNSFIRVPVRRLSPKEVAEKYLAKYRDPRTPETANNRYIEHLRNRLIYENAMLENEGGNASNVDMIPGGFITYRNKWGSGPAAEYQILKVNRSPATKRVTSVEIIAPRTIHRMGKMLEEVGGVLVNIERKGENIYRAPTPEELEAFQNRKKARKAATPTISTINPTNEDAQKLQDLWNAEALAKHGESAGVVPVKYMTQAEFSSNLKHNYVFIHEVKIGETPVKLRLKRGGGFYNYHAARQVIVLTDKPQKPLPAIPQVEQAEPAAAGQLF